MKKFEIVTSITVTIEQTHSLYARDEAEVRELFALEGINGEGIAFVSEEQVNVVGDRELERIEELDCDAGE